MALVLAAAPLLPARATNADSTAYPFRIIPLPSIGYSPETRLIFGASALTQFKLPGSGQETRTSNLIPFATYTQNKQYQIKTVYTVFLPHERYIWFGEIDFHYFPENYWGVGYDTSDDDEVLLVHNVMEISQGIYKRVGDRFFTGPIIRYIRQYNVSFETTDGERVQYPELTGAEGYRGLSLGWGALSDSRNSILTPSRGYYLELSSFFQFKDAGSTHGFRKLETDGRKYFNLSGEETSVLALQIRSLHTFGDVPFGEMPELGGRLMMRGMYEGRFRDKHLLAVQTEFRQHIFWRVGAAAFIAAGSVGGSIDDVFAHSWNLTGGGGIRFDIGKEETTNIRLDFGVGPNSSGLYVTFGEAF